MTWLLDHFGLVLGLVAVGTVALLVGGAVLAKRRRDVFARWAAANGFDFFPRDEAWERLDWGSPWGKGRARRATNVLSAQRNGRQVRCFDYRYTEGDAGDGGDATYRFSVFWVRLPKAGPGRIDVRPGAGGRLARAVDPRSIEFESVDFNRAFRVHADDRRFAYGVLHPRMMQFLLDCRAPGFRLIGADLVLVKNGRMVLDEVLPRLAYLETIADNIPNSAWSR